MRCVVTGGLGFIGSHLVKKLVSQGHSVYGVDDLSGGSMDNAHAANYFIYDCRDYKKMKSLFERVKPEVVFHLAANAAEGKSHFSPLDITSRNYDSFLSVLVAGINNGMKRIVVTSSVAVYGSAGAPFIEETTPEPEDLYGLSKLEIEKTLEILSKVHDFEWVVARPHNVYGPKQCMTDPYRNVVTLWMNNILKGNPYVIYGDGSMKRCYTYIDDLIEGLYKLGFEPVNKQIFNLGADRAYSLSELSAVLQEVTGQMVLPEYLPERAQEVFDASLTHTKAKELLGYKTKTSLRKGLRKTWKWVKDQGPQEMKHHEFEIQSEKIPKNWKI